MANTTVMSGRTITITGLDADWYVDAEFPAVNGIDHPGLMVKRITIVPSATDDVAVIRNNRDGTATTGFMIKEIFADARDVKTKDFGEGQQMWPFIDISAWTLGTAANAAVMIELA